MSARVTHDSPVMGLHTAAPRPRPASVRRILDITSPGNIRVFAIAEPLGDRRSVHQDASADIVGAIESAVAGATDGDPEALLNRAFNAANQTVCARNRKYAGADPYRRAFFGLALACVAGDRLLIALAAPGQALVIQNGEPFSFPAHDPDRAHAAGTWTAAPLGMFSTIAPVLFETTASEDDLLVLGGSGLTDFLTSPALADVLTGPLESMEDRLDAALAATPAAGEVLCGRLGAPPIATAADPVRLMPPSLEPVYRELPAPTAISTRGSTAGEHRPEERLDQLHTKIIEASERWLARKPPAPIPIRPEERAMPPVNGGSVRRYQPRHHFSPEVRSVLPRYSQFPWVAVTIVFGLIFVLGGFGFGYHMRQTRASKQEQLLATVQEQYDKAKTTAPPADPLTFVIAAEEALRSAQKIGASDSVVRDWNGRLNDLRDVVQDVHRFARIVSAGPLPAETDGKSAQLVQVGGTLYVVAGVVYQVDATGANLTSLLAPGAKVNGRTAGALVNGAADGDDLVVSDGKTLFRFSAGKWSAGALPATTSGGWLSPIHGAYLGNYYLLDASKQQILKFTEGQLDADPVSWLANDGRDVVANAVGMALDGSIQVLLKNGSIETFYLGKAQANIMVSYAPNTATEIAFAGGSGSGNLYVLERDGAVARLIRYNTQTAKKMQFQPAGEGQPGFNEEAVRAFQTASAFAVNEAAGTVWFLSGGRLWVATLTA